MEKEKKLDLAKMLLITGACFLASGAISMIGTVYDDLTRATTREVLPYWINMAIGFILLFSAAYFYPQSTEK